MRRESTIFSFQWIYISTETSDFIEKSNEADRLKAENERLNECMDAIVRDIRSKGIIYHCELKTDGLFEENVT